MLASSSEVCRLLMKNPKHTVNFASPIILIRSNHCTKLRIKETLHIAKRQPQLMLIVNHCHYFYLMLDIFSFTGYLYCYIVSYLALILLLCEMCFAFDIFALCCILCLRSAVTTHRWRDCSLSLYHIAAVFDFY